MYVYAAIAFTLAVFGLGSQFQQHQKRRYQLTLVTPFEVRDKLIARPLGLRITDL
jgi:hypothetical protein